MLITSDNDSAFALAELMGIDRFVQLMNAKSQEIGMLHTTFSNPTGLDEENDIPSNKSTANDLFLLAKYILITHPQIFEMMRENKQINPENGIFKITFESGEKLIGGKTGYTRGSLGSMILIWENGVGHIFVGIILGSPTMESRIQDMQRLVEWTRKL